MVNSDTRPRLAAGYFLGIYCFAAFFASMMSNLRSLVIMFIGLRTAKKMHRRLLDHLMKVRKTPS